MTFFFVFNGKIFPQNSLNSLPFNTCWERKEETAANIKIASDNEANLLLINSKGIIDNYDLFTGQLLWKVETGIDSIDRLAFDPEIFTIYGSEIKSYSLQTGLYNPASQIDVSPKHLQIFEIPRIDVSDISLNSDFGIVTGDEKGNVTLKNKSQNRSIWNYKTGGRISNLVAHKDKLIVTSFDNFVYSINLSGGKMIWKKRLNGRIIETPLVSNNSIVVTVSGEKTAFLLNLISGETISKIALRGDKYFIKPLLLTQEFVFFQTSEGLALFSQNRCKN